MTYSEFKNKYSGKGIDFDGAYGFQCMDLAHQYGVEVIGQDIPNAPAAKDVWTKDTPGYIKITNTPTGVPSVGDIVIWGTAVGPYGHIAVFDYGDTNKFVSFDQNWPVNSLCHLQNHNYTGVLGWLHPKNTPTPLPSPTLPPISGGVTQTMYQIIVDTYRALCGVEPSPDEIKARLDSKINTYDLERDICKNDQRFYDIWVKYNIPGDSLDLISTADLLKQLSKRLLGH